jgi:glutamyl-tRNA synthetase
MKLRFAPSPTGYLHLGNLRTALLNWLYSHKYQGSMVLRFDDTDQERSQEVFVQKIQEDLAWLGLAYEGPYYQSRRKELYDKIFCLLQEAGVLYPCYESPGELEEQRKQALALGRPPIYDRKSYGKSLAEGAMLEASGIKPHWRLFLPPISTNWTDLIKGYVSYDLSNLSDPVIRKSDGSFLYNFTTVVDDWDMGITHILRAEDHLTNTALQIYLFQLLFTKITKNIALGEDIPRLSLNPQNNLSYVLPEFGHFPLVMDISGAGFSKRLGSLSIQECRNQGLLPFTLINYLAALGTSHAPQLVQDFSKIARSFEPTAYGKGSPKLDMEQVWHLNSKLLGTMTLDEALPFLTKEVPVEKRKSWEKLWLCVRESLSKADDFFIWVEVVSGTLSSGPFSPEDRMFLSKALSIFPPFPLDKESWDLWTKSLRDLTDRTGKTLYKPLRFFLTGQEHGPRMDQLLPLIEEKTLEKRFQSFFQTDPHGYPTTYTHE